jgi:hypothetical protein
LYAIGVLAGEEWRYLRRPTQWIEKLRNYERTSRRGMNWWYDQIDWIGGLPYERATIEQIVDVFANDGFRLVGLIDSSDRYGCNEFVFERAAPPGTIIDARLPGGRSFARRYGRRVVGPYESSAEGFAGRITSTLRRRHGAEFLLLRNQNLVGTVQLRDDNRVVVASHGSAPAAADVFHVVEGILRKPTHPFVSARGRMWVWNVPDLARLADNVSEPPNNSPVFLFEDGVQLPWPRALHADIENRGAGRFSHWGDALLFAPTDNSDPNRKASRFSLAVATEGLPDHLCSQLRLLENGN